MTVDAGGDWVGGATGHALADRVHRAHPRGRAWPAPSRASPTPSARCTRRWPPSATASRPAAATPSALLLAVLEECLRCRREGRYAVSLSDAVIVDDLFSAGIDTVPADDPHVHAALPPVISWHEVALESAPGGSWTGRIVAR